MATADLTCQELVELVTEYFEETLSESDRRRFEHHLTYCDACVIYLEQMRQTLRAVGHLTPAALDEAGRQVLLSHFRDWKEDNRR